MSDKNYMTKEKYRELEENLKQMQTKGRREIAQKIGDARSHGDLSENADYDAAKEEQGLFEMKIAKLSQLLSNAEIIDPSDFPDDKVYILSKVKVLNKKVKFLSNNAGGILGGISTGEDIIMRLAIKPVSSISKKLKTITKSGKNTSIQTLGRHDCCLAPRIIPVAEAMAALVILDQSL